MQEMSRRYLRRPGNMLAILRVRGAKLDLKEVAGKLAIPVSTLEAYEKGEAEPTLPELTALARFYNADLRGLLAVFGHIAPNASSESMGIAAQFDGQLSDAEKFDLRALIERVSKRPQRT